MIYSGTFPEPPEPPGQFNVVDVGNTGRGNVARSRVRHGRRAGSNRKPAQAMLTLGRYWAGRMPVGDKTWWVTRATESHFRTRHNVKKEVTGYALFLMSNMAILTLSAKPVMIPPAASDPFLPLTSFKALDAATNRLEVYAYFEDLEPEDWYCDFMIACIGRDNVTQNDPLKNTKLIGLIHPNETVPQWENPTIPQFLSIPWDVNPGDKMLFMAQGAYGSKGEWTDWRGERHSTQLWGLTAS